MNDRNTPGSSCQECGAALPEGMTCLDLFHQMLFWENEHPENGSVHHLAVLCYHLQHPSLYSPAGLAHAQDLLQDFVEHGLTPETARQRINSQVDSGKRQWKITARSGASGSYAAPPCWTITAADVVSGGIDQYCQNVRAWAASVLRTVKGQ